jgi:dinuclear metal center YbgI/SA1388 family protein
MRRTMTDTARAADTVADTVADWVALTDRHWPERDAEGWDRAGLQVGDPAAAVDTVLVCLDVTREVLDEAEAAGAQLVLAHHPLLLRGLERLTPDTAPGALALRAARAGIALLAAHTNFDGAEGGTSDPVVALLGLRDVRPLVPPRFGDLGQQVKLVTFVPAEHTAAVLDAMSAAGAGQIGEYAACSFRVAGTGTFRPSERANPAVGERGKLNEEPEDRLEMVLPRGRAAEVVAALRGAHPYEEVAFDLVPLVALPESGKGLGRVGDLAEPMTLRAAARLLAGGLPSSFLRTAGDPDRLLRRIAVCGGAGDSLIGAALASGADCFVTGDLRHHPALDALTMGMTLIDAGHYPTEAAALPHLLGTLRDGASRAGLRARLVASAIRTEPWSDWQEEPQ